MMVLSSRPIFGIFICAFGPERLKALAVEKVSYSAVFVRSRPAKDPSDGSSKYARLLL
ncbi:hypothetical protein DSECCO2_575010 [anaerobic digester metagenome]